MGYGSYVACAAEVKVSDRGRVKIDRLVLATDCGHVVNPQQVTAQVEGSVAYGLGAMLYQENTVKAGRIVEENFDNYQMMMMEDFPKIETVIAPSGGFWGGVGEPTICVAAPAVLNAVYRGDRHAGQKLAAQEREAAEGMTWERPASRRPLCR